MLLVLFVVIRSHAILHVPGLIFVVRVRGSFSGLSRASASFSEAVIFVVLLRLVVKWQTRSIVVHPGETLKLFVSCSFSYDGGRNCGGDDDGGDDGSIGDDGGDNGDNDGGDNDNNGNDYQNGNDDQNYSDSLLPSQDDHSSSFRHILWSNAMCYTIRCITTGNN